MLKLPSYTIPLVVLTLLVGVFLYFYSNTKTQDTTGSLSLNGKCVSGITAISPNLYSKIETKIGAQNPTYKMGGELYPNALFSCTLDDKTLVASFVYEDTSESNSSHSRSDFKVARFSASGDILDMSPKNNAAGVGGQFVVEDVMNNELRFTSHIVDPCYDAIHSYSFNFKTKKYSEVSKGGDDAECWKELNAHGGV